MSDVKPWRWLQAHVYALFARNPKSNRMAVDLCRLGPGDVLLDVGCGPGAAVRAAAERASRAVGVDNSAAMLDIAQQRSQGRTNVEFVLAGAENLPLADGAVSHVITVHAFHHWSDQTAGLREAHRVLQDGGTLLIVERSSRGKHGITSQKADELCSRLRAQGFAEAAVSVHNKQVVVNATK